MNKDVQMPPGVVDLGEGKGLAITMETLRDKNGVVVAPPEALNKEQTIEWIRKRQNDIKG